MEFNEKLKQLRTDKGLTLKAVAVALNIKVSTYSNYEQGIREPSMLTVKRLCRYFEVSADYLLGIEED